MMGHGNWCIHPSQLLAMFGYATGENSLGLVIVIVNSLPPNFVPPVAADRTAYPGGHLRREEASDGLSPNQVGRLSSSDCRCQHGARRVLMCDTRCEVSGLSAKINGLCKKRMKRTLPCAQRKIICLGLELEVRVRNAQKEMALIAREAIFERR